MASTDSAAAVGESRSFSLASKWIVGSWQDLLLIIATPLILIPLFALARAASSTLALTTFATILALGHHLPGMMRAYGDRALFQRFKIRFIVAPIFLVSASVLFAIWQFQTVLILAWAWGIWHWMMQSYGFMRIYDAKVKSFDAKTCWLDFAMCVSWFGLAVIFSPRIFHRVMDVYYMSGGPLIPSGFYGALRIAWATGTIVVTVLFLLHAYRQYLAGSPPSILKLALMPVTFVFYWYTIAVVPNVLVAYALFESYHDIQYLTIVWLFNRNRAEKGADAGAFTRFLFRKRSGFIVLYVIICLTYGSFDFVAKALQTGLWRNVALALVASSSMLHFYYDGFIWKIREKSTSDSLDLKAGETRRVARLPLAWRHALLWCLFIVPMIVFGSLEARGKVPPALERQQAVAHTLASNALAQAQLCAIQLDGQMYNKATESCRRALKLDPTNGIALVNAGNLAAAHGHFDEARSLFRRAIQHNPENDNAYTSLGTTLAQQGETKEGIEYLQKSIALEPKSVESRCNLGVALASLGETEQAIESYRAALRIDPRHARAHQLIGISFAMENEFAKATEHLEQAIAIDPTFVAAHNSLGELCAMQGKLTEAKAHFRRALEIDPKYTPTLENMRRLGATGGY